MLSELNNFLSYLALEKNYSKNTLGTYARYIKRLIQFLLSIEIISVSMVDQEHFIKFVSKLKQEGLGENSIRLIIEACKSFFRFLKKEYFINSNPIASIESPKFCRKIPSFLSVNEMFKLIETPNLRHKRGIRDRAILELLYSAGIRVSELCDLKFEHFNLDKRTLLVFGKGAKERMVIFSKSCLSAICSYWLKCRPNIKPQDFAFVTLTETSKKLDRVGMWKTIRKYAKECGLSHKNIHPHTFRHCFASHLLDNGAELRVIQDLLGHSDIGTTGYYLQISLKKLKDNFYKYHPRSG